MRDYVCDAIASAAPLVSLVHTIAHEWAAPYQRKGKVLDEQAARRSLCAYDGSPCPLFEHPLALLSGFAAHLGAESPLAVMTAGNDAQSAGVARLVSRLREQPKSFRFVSPPAHADVLLLSMTHAKIVTSAKTARAARALATLKPALVLLVAEEAVPASSWATAITAFSLGARQNESSFLFPPAGSPTAGGGGGGGAPSVPSGSRGRRRRHEPPPPALYTAAILWPPGRCSAPLYDLRRPTGWSTAAELSAVTSAVAAGYSFSEWYACATLEVLQPLVRNLFRLPRRKGKSVWATCMRVDSPCYWFTGVHRRGEHFITQVKSICACACTEGICTEGRALHHAGEEHMCMCMYGGHMYGGASTSSRR